MFRARLPSIFITSHKLPRLPHRICTLSPLDAALTKRFAKTHDTTRLKRCACHAKWRWTPPKCCACHDSRHITKHVWMSRSATPAPRNEATRHAQPPKVSLFARTYHRHGHTGLARKGCGRSRTVADGWATSSEHTLNPQTSRVKREPSLYAFGKKHSPTSFLGNHKVWEVLPMPPGLWRLATPWSSEVEPRCWNGNSAGSIHFAPPPTQILQTNNSERPRRKIPRLCTCPQPENPWNSTISLFATTVETWTFIAPSYSGNVRFSLCFPRCWCWKMIELTLLIALLAFGRHDACIVSECQLELFWREREGATPSSPCVLNMSVSTPPPTPPLMIHFFKLFSWWFGDISHPPYCQR